ncbi:arginine--tRNA ligase [Hydrogenivirga sp. 128-5-R1-1]|uniref:arginine--tRNA ligase n=1 Tax=Hydrogenivirga sp. 128-5-R1-1 TaxID=392423 RepID=UPI00015F3A27|nr:arginine--tRNA ligase [Hydrogenivirga sp. 128-5-R1-1]EDP75005.1 arginyl-tRNA synthetase [Hydrogenivirga sp. 128-5-R1-1]
MREQLEKKIQDAIRRLFSVEPPQFKVEKPRDEKHGDLATNVAFLLSRELKRAPNDIASQLAEELSRDADLEGAEAVRGFVNVRFSREFFTEEFSKLLREGEEYYRENLGGGMKIQLEFVSANPTGPLHLGHGRGAVVGDTLARLFRFYGYNVTREYYINDAGRQVYLLGVSVLFRYLELFGREKDRPEIKELFEKEGYKGQYVVELARLLREAVGELLLKGEVEEARKKILSHGYSFELGYIKKYRPNREPDVELCAAFGLDAMMDEIRRDLSEMDIEFDVWYSERSLYERGLVDELIEEFSSRGLVYEEEGALWLKTSEFGDDKDRVLRKSDGSYTYFASDIAYHWDKFKRGFEKVLDLWGADHHGYIPRVKASLKMLGIPEDWLEVYLIQMVKLFKEGKEVKMSKRAGNFVTLRELVDEVGADAVRLVFLTKRSDTPLDFDVDRVKEKSSENPVFYVQYAHARISGVFREFRERTGKDPEKEDFSEFLKELKEDAELKLMRKVLMMKDELMDVTLKRDPHLITYALIDLAGTFHNYYNHHRIIGSDHNLMFGRIALLKGIRSAIRISLKLIGVSAPEKM